MAVTAVAASRNIDSAALNLNAKAAELRQNLYGVWELANTNVEPPVPEALVSHDMVLDRSEEGVIGNDDGRILVEPKHFAPGGKYRSIVKILTHHEFQKRDSWMIGTGWLIRPDLLVTAGHCVYDWGHKFGRVTELKAYIGYDGAHTVSDPNVQFRRGKKVVCPTGWLANKGMKPRDVSFVQLDEPFTGISPINFKDTTSRGHESLGVVGYPGDKYDRNTHEKGAHMYEMFEQTEWDLSENSDTMLQYKIDTFGGNSGSPVLIEGTNTSIGAHVYGGSVDSFNSASVIGPLGNLYGEAVKAFEIVIPKDSALHIISVPSAASQQALFQPVGLQQTGFRQPAFNDAGFRYAGPSSKYKTPSPARTQIGDGYDVSEESFASILKDVIKIGTPIAGGVLQTALPIALGPLGIPISALANIALSQALKLTESSLAEGVEVASNDLDGVVERAILAEAALDTLVKIQLSHDEEESLFSDMKDMVLKALPSVKKVAIKVLPAMMEPALRIAVDSLHKKNQGNGAESFGNHQESFIPIRPYPDTIDQPTRNRQNENFLNGLLMATSQPGAESGGVEEGLGDIIKIGIRFGLPIISGVHDAVTKYSSLFESEEVDEFGASPVPKSTATIAGLSIDALAKRAVVSDAALRALVKLPPQQLEEAGFFDAMIRTIGGVAPIVGKVAPLVIDNVVPIAMDLVRRAIRQESAAVGAESRFDPNALRPALDHVRVGEPRIRKQRSQVLPRGQPAANFLDRANRFVH